MTAFLRRLSWAAAFLLLVDLVLAATGEPAFAATPCYASSCDGTSPFDPKVTSGCGSFVAYGGVGDSTSEHLSILYSKTCHAAYAEFDIPAGADDQHAEMLFYQPQYAGPAKAVEPFTVSSTVVATTLLSWDYTMKGCVVYSIFGSFTDPEPNGPDASNADFCSLWV